jgi:hypothetical protein
MTLRPFVLTLAVSATLLQGQSITEYGATTGSAAATAAAAGAGKSAAGVFGKVGKLLSGETKPVADDGPLSSPSGGSRPAPTATAAKQPSAPAAAPVVVASISAPTPTAPEKPANLGALETGMDRGDMLTKVGKPSMSMSVPESSTLVETCWYKNGSDSVTVTLRNGKVSNISGLEKSAPK